MIMGLVLVSAGAACKGPAARTPALTVDASSGRTLYGAPLVVDTKAIAIATLLATPAAFANQAVTVEGHVRKACTRKGCWMEIAGSDDTGVVGKGPGARVTFKNYGFFVPTDSAGAQARVQGNVEVDTLSAAAVRHYEEEGAVFPGKKPDGTAPEVRLVATGVEMWRGPGGQR